MSETEQYLEFIREAGRLKSTVRTAWSYDGRPESTAEHSWRLALLAAVMLAEFPGLDAVKVLKMCLIHDIGEIYEGDVSAFLKPDAQKKYETEKNAAGRVFSLLPRGQEQEWRALWEEYEKNDTEEAHLVKALDKAETILQHNQGKNPEDFNYEFNLGYGAEYFEKPPVLQKLRDILDRETRTHLEEN